MSLWTTSECQMQIDLLKQDLINLRGQAEKERFQEGNTQYETQNAIKSVLDQINYFNQQMQIAQSEINGNILDVGYIDRREY